MAAFSEEEPPPPVRLLTLASLTAHTGNHVTAERISRAISSSSESCLLDTSAFSTPAALGDLLRAKRIDLVVGVHAYRAGRLLLDCGVPFVIVLGGTDMNEHIRDPEKSRVIKAAVAQAAATVAFSEKLYHAVTTAVPAAVWKTFIIPQAVTSPLLLIEPPLEEGEEAGAGTETEKLPGVAIGDEERRAVRAMLQLPGGASGDRESMPTSGGADDNGPIVLLLPAGLRPVKAVLWAAAGVAKWAAEDAKAGRPRRVLLRIVGPKLDDEYARQVSASLSEIQLREKGVAGDGDAESGFSSVAYCGAMTQRQLHVAMAEATVVLNTSESEGMCNSILEVTHHLSL